MVILYKSNIEKFSALFALHVHVDMVLRRNNECFVLQINWLVVISERESVYCAVLTLILKQSSTNFSSSKSWNCFRRSFCNNMLENLRISTYIVSSVYYRQANYHWLYAGGSVTGSIHFGFGPFKKYRLGSTQCSLYLETCTGIFFLPLVSKSDFL